MAKAQEKKSYSQLQHHPRNSPQTQAGRDVHINYNNSPTEKKKKIRDFHLLKYIYDNRRRPFYSKELASIANKDLEETNESLRYFQEKGLIALGNTDETASFAIILKAPGIDLVEETIDKT